MTAVPPLSDLLVANDPRWPRHHERSLDRAQEHTRPGDTWALLSYWRHDLSVAASWSQYDAINDGLNGGVLPPINVQTLVAHFDAGPAARTRFEPWAFLSGDVKLELCRWMLALLHQEVGFWSDGSALHVVTRRASRNLGTYRAGAIAAAIRETARGERFVGFDIPTTNPVEAMARAAYVGDVAAGR